MADIIQDQRPLFHPFVDGFIYARVLVSRRGCLFRPGIKVNLVGEQSRIGQIDGISQTFGLGHVGIGILVITNKADHIPPVSQRIG